jgi:hypothetical protein
MARSEIRKKTFDDFRRDARKTGNVIAMQIFRPNEALAAALLNDRAYADKANSAYLSFRASLQKVKKGNGPLCLTCDTEFLHRGPTPLALVVISAYLADWPNKPTTVLATPVCRECAKRSNDDLLNAAKTLWKTSNPGAYEIQEPKMAS